MTDTATDLRPEPAPPLALVRATQFAQIAELAKCLDALDTIAKQLASSSILPKEMQNPSNLKLVLLQGLEMGFTPLQAIRASFVIVSKEGTKVGYYVDSLVALVRSSKVCRFFRVDETTADKCRVTCARTDEAEAVIHTFELTMAQALAAGLDKKNEWNPETRQLVQKQKYVWKSAPADMLRARCQGRAVKSVFQDVVFGMYTGEEHEDIAAAEAIERNVDAFVPIPTAPQPRRARADQGPMTQESVDALVALVKDHPKIDTSANTYQERAAERRAADVVDADIVEEPPTDEPIAPGEDPALEGTGDPAWDGIMLALATLSGIDTRGWIPPEFMKLWNERIDAVRTRDQLRLLQPWVSEMAKGAEKSKACADCAASMKSSYNSAHAATRAPEAKP